MTPIVTLCLMNGLMCRRDANNLLEKSFSNHCPIVMKDVTIDWGPKSFKVQNWWLEKEGFLQKVKDWWSSYNTHGWAAYVLKEKLKLL